MKQVFVFGSNEAGVHGAGAARVAYEKHGARWGKGFGHYGDSFAIPTKSPSIETLELNTIRKYVEAFLQYAAAHKDLTFKVTRIGCGLAGYRDTDIAPMFWEAPSNCIFDNAWLPVFQMMDETFRTKWTPEFWGSVK